MTDRAILDHISSLPHARGTFKQLVKELGAKGASRAELEAGLDRLVARGELLELRSGHFTVTARTREYAVGRLNMHRDGYGFLISERPIDDGLIIMLLYAVESREGVVLSWSEETRILVRNFFTAISVWISNLIISIFNLLVLCMNDFCCELVHQFKKAPLWATTEIAKDIRAVRGNVNFIQSSLTPAHCVLFRHL